MAITFAPAKTQAVIILRRQDAVNSDQPRHSPGKAGKKKYTYRSSVNILRGGVRLWTNIHQTRHEGPPRIAAWKLSCIRRVAHLLDDAQGVGTLYKSQVRYPEGILTPRMVLLPPVNVRLLDWFKPEAERLSPRLKLP
ncbi:hypothetical protein GWK47_052297 [Chionoecetes opilio]|uniref:Uncharacterized protein n=1 Tax=Chionoecetes opilio TaxID=41210 RepID=A0A8J4Y1K6_CHIOP|nr:hypothetical protein GWK47_052297 [Chionoecetes opilio]